MSWTGIGRYSRKRGRAVNVVSRNEIFDPVLYRRAKIEVVFRRGNNKNDTHPP